MKRSALVVLASFSTLVLVGSACSKKPVPAATEAPAASAASSSAGATATDAALAPAAAQSAAGSGFATTLSDRLLKEAQNRPHIEPNADDVLAALTKAGGAFGAKKQGLAATYKASFCEGSTTADGAVTAGICEYADEASAKVGLDALQAIYPAKKATHTLHKATVLTTLRLQDGPAAQALEAKLIAAYKAL
jgi:hypothetical protein